MYMYVCIIFLQILKEVKMNNLEEELKKNFTQDVLICASKLQSSNSSKVNDPVLHAQTCEMFGEELLKCLKGLSKPQVSKCICGYLL